MYSTAVTGDDATCRVCGAEKGDKAAGFWGEKLTIAIEGHCRMYCVAVSSNVLPAGARERTANVRAFGNQEIDRQFSLDRSVHTWLAAVGI